MKLHCSRVSLLLALSLAAACSSGVEEMPAPMGPDAVPGSEVHLVLEDLTHELVDSSGSPGKAIGLVVGVATPNARYIAGFGSTEKNGATAPDQHSIFDLASLSKVYTGYLLARGILNNEVQLNDAANDYLQANLQSYDEQPVTLLDLATHTSALPNYPDNLTNPNRVNPAAGYTLDLLNAFLESYLPLGPPGVRYQYSNLGSGLLAHILVSQAGEPDFQALIDREINQAYDLVDTFVYPCLLYTSDAADDLLQV